MFYYLVVFYLCYLSPFLSYPTSFNLFNVLLGSWAAMAVGGWAVIAFGSGVAGLSVLFPHPHSTHDSMLALPVMFSSRACSLCPSCILSTVCSPLPTNCLLALHTQALGVFGSHAGFLPLPHELLSTHELQIASFLLCVHPQKKTEPFFLTQGLHCLFLSLLVRIV